MVLPLNVSGGLQHPYWNVNKALCHLNIPSWSNASRGACLCEMYEGEDITQKPLEKEQGMQPGGWGGDGN